MSCIIHHMSHSTCCLSLVPCYRTCCLQEWIFLHFPYPQGAEIYSRDCGRKFKGLVNERTENERPIKLSLQLWSKIGRNSVNTKWKIFVNYLNYLGRNDYYPSTILCVIQQMGTETIANFRIVL